MVAQRNDKGRRTHQATPFSFVGNKLSFEIVPRLPGRVTFEILATLADGSKLDERVLRTVDIREDMLQEIHAHGSDQAVLGSRSIRAVRQGDGGHAERKTAARENRGQHRRLADGQYVNGIVDRPKDACKQRSSGYLGLQHLVAGQRPRGEPKGDTFGVADRLDPLLRSAARPARADTAAPLAAVVCAVRVFGARRSGVAGR